MKLNNKGFAITAVLYGLLILFVIFVSMYLLVLSAKKDRIDDLVEDIETEYKKFPEILSVYIQNLYDDARKIKKTNSINDTSEEVNIKNYSFEYNYAESVSLMNDRFADENNANYNYGNIRYYGANPRNYVDIGDRDSSGNVILYRIIGLFKDVTLSDGSKQDLVKVIRADSIGNYSWDNKTAEIGSSISKWGSNDWTDSRLMILLNPGYADYSSTNPLEDASGDIIYGYEGSLWWNSKSGTCYSGFDNATKSCNFTSTGLSSDIRNKIEEVVWNLGGYRYASMTSTDIYQKERNGIVYPDGLQTSEDGKDTCAAVEGTIADKRPTTWTGKITLMHPSDYSYATDFGKCNQVMNKYAISENCHANNWLYLDDNAQWTVNHWTHLSCGVRRVVNQTNSGKNMNVEAYTEYSVRPTFYLKYNTMVTSGRGTHNNPYKIEF